MSKNTLEQADEVVYASGLSKKLNVSTARIAALLKRMEQNGLITRYTSPVDARRTIVEITPADIASVDEMRKLLPSSAGGWAMFQLTTIFSVFTPNMRNSDIVH